MVPVKSLTLKENIDDNGENQERDTLLYYLELNKCKRSAIAYEAYAVGRNLTAIFKKGDEPAEYYNAKQRPV